MQEKIGPRINITIKLIARLRIVTAIACVKLIPTNLAEKIFIASPIPKFAGVIVTISPIDPIEAMNRDFKNPISFPKILY